MPISVMQWRVEMGMFSRKSKVRYQNRTLLPTMRHLVSCSSGFGFILMMLLLLICGGTE